MWPRGAALPCAVPTWEQYAAWRVRYPSPLPTTHVAGTCPWKNAKDLRRWPPEAAPRRGPSPKGEGRRKEAKNDGWGERPSIIFRGACGISRGVDKGVVALPPPLPATHVAGTCGGRWKRSRDATPPTWGGERNPKMKGLAVSQSPSFSEGRRMEVVWRMARKEGVLNPSPKGRGESRAQ
jgi:hypothetical protein